MGLNVLSQSTNTRKWRKTESDTMLNAVILFDEQKFLLALPLFEKLYINHPNEEVIKYGFARCAIYRTDLHDVALKLLNEVYDKNKKVENIKYDLAVANHLNYKFDEALALLDLYLAHKRLKVDDKKLADQLKKYCLNGKEFFVRPTKAKIENIGSSINSEDDEYVPVVSADELIMLYTYRGPKSLGGLQNDALIPDKYGIYYEDVFQSNKSDNKWQTPISIKSINTNSHDGAIAISPDGSYLFVYRDSGDDHGDIYVSNSFGGEWSFPKKLQGEVNSYSWEGSCSITADGKQLYFSSERAGGFGGKDIYKATLLPDSTWGNVVNLGDSINTSLDDDAPFIHADGVTLFYSSKGKNSMGGYDVFQSNLNVKDSTFSSPINLGYPINTPNDDIYYVLSANAERGYYASGKKGGLGLKDIYTVSDGFVGKHPSLYIVSGFVTESDWPVTASITVESANKKIGVYYSNPSNGKYFISLPKGGDFKLVYKYKNLPTKTLDVNTMNLEGYEQKTHNINFDTTQVLIASVPKKDTVLIAPVVVKTAPAKIIKEPAIITSAPKVINKPVVSAGIAAVMEKANLYAVKNGNIAFEDLTFRVQVAAFKYPKNYEYPHLKGLGEVEHVLLNDGITRITIGGTFKTLSKAIEHNAKVLNAGQKDAFVTIIYKGNRIQFEDLEKMGVFVK